MHGHRHTCSGSARHANRPVPTVRRREQPRWLRLLVGILGLVLAWSFVSATPASAHAGLVAADPVADSVLEAAPTQAALTFNEPVNPVPAMFRLYDSAGRHTTGGEPTAIVVTSQDAVVTAGLPPELAQGSYVLTWRVVSVDGHPINGLLPFVVGQASATPPPVPDTDPESLRNPVNATFLLLQVLGYLALLGAVGLRVFDSVVLTGPAAAQRSRSRLLHAGVVVAVVVYALLVPLTWVRERALPLGAMFGGSAWFQGWSSTAAVTFALAAAGSLLLLVAGRLPRSTGRVLAGVGALVAVASVLPTGHTRTYGSLWLMSALDLLHAGAAAVWFGGLIGLGLHLAGSRRLSQDPVPVASTVARFSGLAGILVALLGVSGVVMAWEIAGSVRGIFDSDYGRALLVKLALVAVVGLLALWNRFVLVNAVRQRSPGSAQWRRLRGAVVDEAVIVVVALAVTGLLTMQTPPAPASGAPASPDSTSAAPVVRESALGTGTVQGRLVRTSGGRNGVEIVLRDASGAVVEPADPPEVTASLPAEGLGPLQARVTDLEGAGRYGVEVPVPAAGEWEFVVSARFSRSDNPSATLVIPVPG